MYERSCVRLQHCTDKVTSALLLHASNSDATACTVAATIVQLQHKAVAIGGVYKSVAPLYTLVCYWYIYIQYILLLLLVFATAASPRCLSLQLG
jgi:hypothetical protein